MRANEESNINLVNLENAFLKVALDAVVSMDASGRIIEFNPAAEKIFGRERAAVLGREMAEVIIPERYREAHRKGLSHFMKTGQQKIFGKRMEFEGLHSSGREFPIELTVTQLSSEPVVFTGIIRDISEKKKMEEELRKSRRDLEVKLAQTEERFQIMIGATEDYAIIMLDPDGYVLTWNEGAKKIHGFEAVEIIGKHVSEFYIEGDRIRQKPQRELAEARKHGRWDDEIYLVRKNGTVFWASCVVTALHDEAGRLIGYSKITRDLTERKRHEDKLRQMRDELQVQVEEQTRELSESRDQLDIILRGISDGIAVMDEGGEFIFVNDAGAQICGVANAEEFMTRSSTELFENFEFISEKGEEINLKEQQIDPALRGDRQNELLARFRLKDTGEEKWLMIRVSPVYDHKRNVRMAVSIFKDFTERKRIEDSLKYLDEASNILSASLDYKQTLDAIARLAVSQIADWCTIQAATPGENSDYITIVQHKDREKIKLLEEMSRKFPNRPSNDRGVAKVMRTGESELYRDLTEDFIREMSQSEEHFALASQLQLRSAIIVPLTSRGTVFGALTLVSSEYGRHYTEKDLAIAEELARRGGVAIDNAILFAEVQEEKRQHQEAHQKMEKLAEAAESASQVKSLFLANMSHEIRTPLGAILGFTDLLNDPNLTAAEREKYRSIINRNGRQLIQLIDDILDLSKVEAGHLDIENLEMSLATLLTDIESILKFRASEKGLTFEVISESSAPDMICTDPTRLRQILINIVGNAIKFTEQGGVRVLVSASGENQREVHFVVEDTGLGISKENQERLFEWFTQADSSTTRKFGGTGLGLALSRRLARSLGGDIQLESSDKSGSRFLISIINRNLPGEYAAADAPKKKNNYEHLKDDLKGVRVLLVEDSADNRMLVESVLTRQGVIVATAENGREGVDRALSEEFDLILMDIQMPVLDGIQATAELRSSGYTKPIVALTAHAMKEEREKTLGAGCNAHLTKPLVVSKLLNIIVEFTRS